MCPACVRVNVDTLQVGCRKTIRARGLRNRAPQAPGAVRGGRGSGPEDSLGRRGVKVSPYRLRYGEGRSSHPSAASRLLRQFSTISTASESDWRNCQGRQIVQSPLNLDDSLL